MAGTIYTIGHSNHSDDDFHALLDRHQITALCDVRSSPYSRFNPQFNRELLKDSLRQRGIAYLFMGKELGGRPENPACYEAGGRVIYSRVAKEPTFRSGLSRLVHGMSQHRIVLACAEKDPIECHRALLISRELKAEGISVSHVREDGSLEDHSDLEKRLMKLTKQTPDLFRDESRALDDAYETQGRRVAFVDPQMVEPASKEQRP